MKEDKNNIYIYLLIYVDNIIAISNDPGENLNDIGKFFWFKVPPEIPNIYLEAQLSKV